MKIAQLVRLLLRDLAILWRRLFGGKEPDPRTPAPAELVAFLADAQEKVTTAIRVEAEAAQAATPGVLVTKAVEYRVTKATEMLAPSAVMAGGQAVAQAGLAQGNHVVKDIARAERDAHTMEKTREVRAEAQRLGDEWGSMWVAHRDCCVRCLAYSGLIIPSDGFFDGGLSFRPSDVDRFAESIDGPPLHPNDRCHLQLVHIATAQSASDALKREALRQGVLGWSRMSESEKARRETAQALLHRNLTLPKSVLETARKRLVAPGQLKRPAPHVG